MKVSAVIVGAGRSQRMAGKDKQFTHIEGKPVLMHTLSAFANHPQITEVVVVVKTGDTEKTAQLIDEYAIPKVSKIVVGGNTRQQ